MSLSENINLDFVNNSSAYGYLTLGNPATGTNETETDYDNFNVYLQAGVKYYFYIDGTSYPSGSENNNAYIALFSPTDSLIDISSGSTSESLIYTPTKSGFYGVSAAPGDSTGSYFLSYSALNINDDYDSNYISSPYLLTNGPTFGTLEIGGDSDGFVVSLQEGQRYYYEYSSDVADLYVAFQDWTYTGLPGVVTTGNGSGSFVAEESADVLLTLSSNTFRNTGDYYIYMSPTYTTDANLIIGGSGNDKLKGTSASDEIQGSWGEDKLYGGAGSDYLFGGLSSEADYLNGGTGKDRLAGGLGDDTYVVDNIGDRVIESSKSGDDMIFSSVSLTLGANIEYLILDGKSNLTGTGNSLANVVFGNDGANSISGGNGDDILSGWLGKDKLTGGKGADTFVFDSKLDGKLNFDKIVDFKHNVDTIQLENSIFKKLGAEGALSSQAFFAGTAAHDASDRIIYNSSTGSLFYDPDGNGSKGAIHFADVTAGTTLTVSDFWIS